MEETFSPLFTSYSFLPKRTSLASLIDESLTFIVPHCVALELRRLKIGLLFAFTKLLTSGKQLLFPNFFFMTDHSVLWVKE
jgi:hypothetical protein